MGITRTGTLNRGHPHADCICALVRSFSDYAHLKLTSQRAPEEPNVYRTNHDRTCVPAERDVSGTVILEGVTFRWSEEKFLRVSRSINATSLRDGESD